MVEFNAGIDKTCTSKTGFATIDALVALGILATTIALSLNVLSTSQKTARRALEIRQATALLRNLTDTSPARPGHRSGETPRFRWQVSVEEETARNFALSVRLCRITATAESRRGGRPHSLTTARACGLPVSEAAS